MAAGKAFTLLTTIPLKPESVDEFLVLVDEVNDRMRTEPTFLNTVLSRSMDEPGLIVIHEMWTDRDNFFDVQMKRDYRKRYEERLPALLRAERTMKTFEIVRADFAFMSGSAGSMFEPGKQPSDDK